MVKKLLAHLILDLRSSKVSWSKIWSLITATISSVVLLQQQLINVGISIPTELMPYFKVAAILSALVTVIRLRNSASTTKE